MNKFNWHFPARDGGTRQGYNDGGIATFKGADLYNNLAREICQNSLDAKAEDKKHVVVKFNLTFIEKNKFNAICEFEEIIKSCKEYWGMQDSKFASFIQSAEKLLCKDTIPFLVISDYNTKGLTGAQNTLDPNTVWSALANSTGVTNKSSGGSGGSYGIGKSAPFACSLLRTVFYNTYAEDDCKAFQGVARLVTHKNSNGVETQGDGYFNNTEKQEPIFGNDECSLRDLFDRTEYGTDVIVAGFNAENDWQEVITKAIIKNFFVAIQENTLIVHIGDSIIDASALPSLLRKYAEEELEDVDSAQGMVEILQLYEALVSPESQCFKTQIIEPDDLYLYFKKGDDYKKRIAEMRAIGMLVRTRSRNVMTRFSAVVIARGSKLNKILKEMEPPKHDEWDPDIIENEADKKRAKKIRGDIIRWVNSTIVEQCQTDYQEEIDPDGISQFLPLELEESLQRGAAKSTNAPDGDTTVSNIRKKIIKMKSMVSPSINTTGVSTGGAGNNKTTGGTKHNPGGEQDPKGEEKVHVEKQRGKNSVENSPKVLYQRSYPITPKNDVYKTIIVLEEDSNSIHIAAKAIGDDGKSEPLTIQEYTLNSKKTSVNGKSIGPLKMQANVKYTIYMKLSISERLLINILVY